MPAELDALSICRLALEKGGLFSINDTGPRGREMERAREWLDMVVSNIAARRRCWWLHPETATIPLRAGVAEYDLNAAVASLAPDGVQFPTAAFLVDAASNTLIEELPLLRRQEWEERPRAPADRGKPEFAHIDRRDQPTLRIHPPPAQSDTYILRLVFQAMTKDLTRGRFNDRVIEFRKAWKMCLVISLAAELVDGPIRKAPQDEVRDMRAHAEKLLLELEQYDAQEQANEPRPVRFFNGIG